jgi:RNA polymerase subunit RPABC4/transcription elongation factor Spt4
LGIIGLKGGTKMRRICKGCGYEIPPESDFCYQCGAWATDSFILNDEGTYIISNTCFNCGKEMPQGAEYCPHCGAHSSDSRIDVGSPAFGRKFTSKHIIALILAIVPGFFNVFGLGQLVLKRWSKAFIFLTMTVILYYLAPSFLMYNNSTIFLILIQVILFAYSLFDIYGAILRGEV